MNDILLTLIHTIFISVVLTQNISFGIDEYNGPASIQYFQQQFIAISSLPQLTCNEGYFYTDWDVSDGTNIYFGELNTTDMVKYYQLHITSIMKQVYKSSMYVSTCCHSAKCDILSWNKSGLDNCDHQFVEESYAISNISDNSDHAQHYETFCTSNSSLDTILYSLQQKKGQLTLIETNDDSTCNNNQKSHIDLLTYPEGDYIIAVGGFAQESGPYFLQMFCLQHSMPIKTSQLNPPVNTTSIACNDIISDALTPLQSVKYYLFNITKTTYLPIIVNTSSKGFVFLYLIKSVTSNYATDSNFEIVIEDYWGTFTIDESILPTPIKHDSATTYYIVVQGVFSNTSYILSMECSDKPTEEPTAEPTTQTPTTTAPTQAVKIEYSSMAALVFSVCGVIFMIFVAYYIYEWRRYKKDKKCSPNMNKSKSVSKQGSNFTSVPQQDNSDENEFKDTYLQPPIPTDIAMSSLNSSMTTQTIKQDDWDRRITRNKSSVAGVTIRRIDKDLQISEQLSTGEDIIQLVLAHSIKCCEDQNGFDIYQVLAIRFYEKDSRRIVGWMPLKRVGINTEFIKLSPFFLTCFQAVFIALTQCWGITVVVYKLIASYISHAGDEDICNMDAERWIEVWSLKVLSFLLSLSITFYIRILMNGLANNGLYKIMAQLSLNDLYRIDSMSLWCVQLGQMVNYYVCLWAILGSYFIIFEGNRGELLEDGSVDYANTGLEMILNAVALFFVLELDDMMITEQDYVDCGDHLALFLKDYEPDIRLNKFYSSSLSRLLTEFVEEIAKQDEVDSGFKKKRADSMTGKAYNKCAECMIPIMYYLVNFCSVFVPFCCYCGGFIAPFLIFFCW